jgi:WD40 repeat protein
MTTGAGALAPKDEMVGLHAMSWSPDGKRLAYLIDKWQDYSNKWHIYDVSTGQSMPIEGSGERLLWKPDGSQFVLIGRGPFGKGVVEFYDAATGKLISGERGFAQPDSTGLRLLPGMNELPNLHLQSVSWCEEGLFAAADATPYPGSGLLVVWDVRTGKRLLTLGKNYDALADQVSAARLVAWAPDGQSLATLGAGSNADARIDVWEAASGRKTRSIAAGKVNFHRAAALVWSPDGRSLAFAGEAVQVWKLALPWLPLTLRQPVKSGPDAELTFLAWSADSRSLAVLDCRNTPGHQQTLTAWDLTTGKERFRWTRPYEFSYLHSPLAWSPDGKRLVWGGPKPGVWNVASGMEEFPIAGHSAAVGDVEWSPDGRRVLSRCEISGGFTPNFEFKVWDAATQQEMFMLRGPKAGWRVAPGFQALASPPGRGSDAGDVVVWDLAPRKE